MKQFSKKSGRAMTIAGGSVYGAALAYVWTLLASGILGWLIHSRKLEEAGVGYGAMVILFSASILAASLAVGKVKRKRLITCLAAGMIYFVMLLATTALFFGGQYQGFGVTALLVFGGSATAALVGMGKGKQKKGAGRKIHI